MKRKIGLSILFIFALSFALTVLAGCGGDDGGEKQVPVYQGMSITSASPYSARAALSGGAYLANNGGGDNGNHNGHYKGDYADRNDIIDDDNPYPDNDSNENIEEEIKSSLNVVGSPDKIYYATPGEDIYINIHIDNPDSFEIMSFTLNGKKYSSYMFEEGSDMETIVLKYNVGDVAGIVEYTIDAIKYIDGTEIKDVIIDGNKTVMAGIKTQNQVAASVSGVDIDTNALSFNVNIKDNNSLIAFSKGTLKAVIYDGFEIVATKDLALGENSVNFDALETNTLYQYAVVGYYDDLSGDGFKMNVLYKDAFYTESVVLFDNITVGQEGLSFSFLWHEDHAEKAITALKLYRGNALVANLDVMATEINNLLSDNTYKLIAEYENGNKTESIYIEFTTAAKNAPEISIANPTSTQTSIGFDINETDIDNVGTIIKIELVHEGGTVNAENLDVRSFDGLLSNNSYTVKVTYTYDLNDGEDEHTVTRELTITTEAKATPEISVVNPTKMKDSVGFDISEVDVDNVGAVTKIELLHEDGIVNAENLDVRSFDGLLSNNTYTVRVTYAYDLNDGEGEHTVTRELTITTEAKATPEISVVNPTKTQTSVGFEINEADADNVGAITNIELVHEDGTVIADSLNQRAFANLLSNNAYTVKITYVYNLNDGEGEHTVTRELTITTEAKATPEISVVNPTKTNDSVGFDISEADVDNVGAVTKIELVHEGVTVNAENLDARSFDGLLSNNAYTVKVTYAYDLNDGEGEQIVTHELSITTDEKIAPSFTVKNENITADSIAAEYDITDIDNILAYYKIEFYKGNTLVAESSDKEINFIGLDYYTEYTVKFTFKYDLNDGDGEKTAAYDYTVKTLPYIDVTECNIANTSAVSEGETIFMSVKLDNPLGMSIESVVINGETYSVTAASTKNKIFVEIVYNGQFAGGDTYLKIDKVNAKIDNMDLNVEPKTELSDNVFINGKLELLKIEFVNDRFEPIDWAFPSDNVYVLVTLDNPTGYTVDSVNTNITGLTKIDEDHWYYQTMLSSGWNVLSLDSIHYHNEYITKSLAYSNVTTDCYKVASNEIRYISTPDDLKNMCDGYYYELTNDINLSGLEWIGVDFYGVFDGKGYNIKNMAFVGTIKNDIAYLGLFKRGCGVIKNANMKNITIIAEIVADDNKEYDAYVGGIIAKSTHLNLSNCSVDDNSIFNIKNASYFSDAHTYVGGIVGYADKINISKCDNSSNINAIGNYVMSGGLLGCSICPYVVINDSYNLGNINSDFYAGGLVGECSQEGFVNINNCYNYGNITSNQGSGGLIGSVWYSIVHISDCINAGLLTTHEEYYYEMNEFIGCDNAHTEINNSYTLSLKSGTINENNCTKEQLDSKAFYTETLGWSEDVWDFSELDIENGKYPKLK